MFKTTAIDTLKQDKKCQACWYMILSTMSGSTTSSNNHEIFFLSSQVIPKPPWDSTVVSTAETDRNNREIVSVTAGTTQNR